MEILLQIGGEVSSFYFFFQNSIKFIMMLKYVVGRVALRSKVPRERRRPSCLSCLVNPAAPGDKDPSASIRRWKQSGVSQGFPGAGRGA